MAKLSLPEKNNVDENKNILPHRIHRFILICMLNLKFALSPHSCRVALMATIKATAQHLSMVAAEFPLWPSPSPAQLPAMTVTLVTAMLKTSLTWTQSQLIIAILTMFNYNRCQHTVILDIPK